MQRGGVDRPASKQVYHKKNNSMPSGIAMKVASKKKAELQSKLDHLRQQREENQSQTAHIENELSTLTIDRPRTQQGVSNNRRRFRNNELSSQGDQQ